jgi:hypothetical protein
MSRDTGCCVVGPAVVAQCAMILRGMPIYGQHEGHRAGADVKSFATIFATLRSAYLNDGPKSPRMVEDPAAGLRQRGSWRDRSRRCADRRPARSLADHGPAGTEWLSRT